jgi:hypothetical protein
MVLYYPVFAQRYAKDDQALKSVLNEYAERLTLHHVTPKQFHAGIAALKAKSGQDPFYPNPEQFALMCKATLTADLPTLQDVMVEIIQRRGVERHNTEWQFSHELTRLINERKGSMIYQLTSIEFEKTIKDEYDHWAKRIASGEQLPEVQACLNDLRIPDLPDYLAKPSAPTCALAKLAAKRAQGEAQ